MQKGMHFGENIWTSFIYFFLIYLQFPHRTVVNGLLWMRTAHIVHCITKRKWLFSLCFRLRLRRRTASPITLWTNGRLTAVPSNSCINWEQVSLEKFMRAYGMTPPPLQWRPSNLVRALINAVQILFLCGQGQARFYVITERKPFGTLSKHDCFVFFCLFF